MARRGSLRIIPYCKKAYDLGRLLAQEGYTVVTGGGPGVMEAGNHGAWDAGGNSVGLNIELPHEQRINPYVRRSTSFHYFFSRKVMLDFSAEAYIFFPGGFGTLDEFAELITLVQTGKVDTSVPIILFGRSFWEPLTDWMRTVMLKGLHTIAAKDLTIWTITDDLDEVDGDCGVGYQDPGSATPGSHRDMNIRRQTRSCARRRALWRGRSSSERSGEPRQRARNHIIVGGQ